MASIVWGNRPFCMLLANMYTGRGIINLARGGYSQEWDLERKQPITRWL